MTIKVDSRQLSDTAATLSGLLQVGDDEVASIEILVINAPREALIGHLQHRQEAAR